MKKILVLMSIVSVAMLGCDDNSNSETTSRCNISSAGTSFVESELNGNWNVKEVCANGCSDGACVTTSETCSSTGSTCEKAYEEARSATVVKSCKDGKVSYTNCLLQGQACTVRDGQAACVASGANLGNECEAGTERCNERGGHEYCAFGLWQNDPCETGVVCANNTCGGTVGCKAGETKCVGLDVYRCINNDWRKSDTCTEKCEDGACKDAPVSGNDKCNADATDCAAGHGATRGTTTIADKYKLECDTAATAECAKSGKKCLSYNGEPRACVEPCTTEGTQSSSCDLIAGDTYYNEYSCTKIDGELVMYNAAYARCGTPLEDPKTDAERECSRFGAGWYDCSSDYAPTCDKQFSKTGMVACCLTNAQKVSISCTGGDATDGDKCLFYDCSNEPTSEDPSITWGQKCKESGENFVPLCDNEKAYCAEHLIDADKQCSGKSKAYQVGESKQCIYVGETKECLIQTCDPNAYIDNCAGSLAQWCSSDGLVLSYDCADDHQECLIYEENGKNVQECVTPCDAQDEGKQSNRCVDTILYGSYAYVDTCTKVGDAYYKLPKSTRCKTTCDNKSKTCATN